MKSKPQLLIWSRDLCSEESNEYAAGASHLKPGPKLPEQLPCAGGPRLLQPLLPVAGRRRRGWAGGGGLSQPPSEVGGGGCGAAGRRAA